MWNGSQRNTRCLSILVHSHRFCNYGSIVGCMYIREVHAMSVHRYAIAIDCRLCLMNYLEFVFRLSYKRRPYRATEFFPARDQKSCGFT